MKTISFSFFAVWLVVSIACSSSKSTSSHSNDSKAKSAAEKEDLNAPADLIEYLRRVPGVAVSGSGSSARVSVRGMSSFSTDAEPLLVVNGTPYNGGLSGANATISVSEIRSVRVLKSASEVSFYGTAGSSGVILLYLKTK